MPALAHERALALISLPHRTLHRHWDMARVGARTCGTPARAGRCSELLLLELPSQSLERSPEDPLQVRGPHQRLDVAELVAVLTRESALQPVAPRRDRSQLLWQAGSGRGSVRILYDMGPRGPI